MIPTFIRFPLAVKDAKFYADIYKVWFGLVGKIEAKFYADIWTEIGMSHNCVTMHNFHIYGPFTGRGEEESVIHCTQFSQEGNTEEGNNSNVVFI